MAFSGGKWTGPVVELLLDRGLNIGVKDGNKQTATGYGGPYLRGPISTECDIPTLCENGLWIWQ